MSDLSARGGDHRRAASDRNDSRKRRPRDLISARGDLVVALLLAACATRPEAVNRPATKVEVWVDGSYPGEGLGTRAQPFKRVPTALEAGVAIHLSSGLYKGPFTFPDGVEVQGHGSVVLYLEEPGTVATVGHGRFENVSFQGGTIGLAASRAVALQGVRFSGFRAEGLHVGEAGMALVSAGEVVGTIGGSKGVVVEGGQLAMRGTTFRGALGRAVEVQRGSATLDQVKAEGVGSLVHALDSTVQVTGAEATAGRGPAVYAAGGALSVKGLTVIGHEYAVLATRALVQLDGVSSRDAQLAGLALQRCSGTVTHAQIVAAGTLGGVQVLDAEGLTLDGVSVSGAESTGLLVRGGAVKLKGIRVENVRHEGQSQGEPILGDGLQLRDAKVTMDEVSVRDVDGSAVWLGAFAEVTCGRLEAERTGSAAVVVERGSSLTAKRIGVNAAHGPAVLAIDGGKVKVGTLTAVGAEAPVWAECEQEVEVSVDALVTEAKFPPSPCVRIGAKSAP